MQDTRVLETDAAEVMAIDEADIDRALALITRTRGLWVGAIALIGWLLQ